MYKMLKAFSQKHSLTIYYQLSTVEDAEKQKCGLDVRVSKLISEISEGQQITQDII